MNLELELAVHFAGMIKSPHFGMFWLHICFLLLPVVSASDHGFSRCNCDDEGSLWSIERIMDCQRVSDFLIAVAYFSIPIELLYFISCSNVPFKWVLVEFIAFIVLCGLTHLLNGWTYGPHPFQLILALTVFKILTALVSCATAITLFTLIPMLLKVKVREFMLKKKTWDLGREVGIIMKQREAGLHVRMLTQVIRNSLDRHTILYTTLVELSKMLMLQNCAIWMPDETRKMMNLTHALSHSDGNVSIPITNPDVVMIGENNGVYILSPESALAAASRGKSGDLGSVAAIRMPMLRVSNFKGGTPEMVQACYAILVLVLPGGEDRSWTNQELEIVQVVADQVAVAISHAAVLEESQLMREKLEVQNHALQQARKSAMMASQARIAFQKVMSDGMKKPMHSILGLISMIQDGELSSEQRVIVDAMMKTSNVLSTLINDAMEISSKDSARFSLEMKPFHLQSVVREVACTAKCLCAYAGAGFSVEIDKTLPANAIGDERRLMQVVLHMMVNLLNRNTLKECVTFRVACERGQQWPEGDIGIRIEMSKPGIRRNAADSIDDEDAFGYSVCKKLVKMMQGSIWVDSDSEGLRFQLHAPANVSESSDHPHSNIMLRGLHVLLVDGDNLNRVVTRKFLEKLGCCVTAVATGFDCLSAVTPASSPFRVVILNLKMPDLDGYEIAARIRKFRSSSWPVIVAFSACFDKDVWERCQQAGMNGMIRKPVMMQGIAKELRRVLLQSNHVH